MSIFRGNALLIKTQLLEKIDSKYLIELAISICNNPKYFYRYISKEGIIKVLVNKLNKDQISRIYRYYLIDYAPQDVGNIIRQLNGDEIRESFIKENIFKDDKFFLREVLLKYKKCDLVVIDPDFRLLRAIEIKANGDKIFGAVRQCGFYLNWADETLLIIDKRHLQYEKIILQLKDMGIGIIIFDEFCFNIMHKSKKMSLDIEKVLKLLPKYCIKNISRENNLKITGNKAQLISYLTTNLKREELLKNYRKQFLNLSFI